MTLQYSEVVINAAGFGLTMQEGEEEADSEYYCYCFSLISCNLG